jgi:hypothetical protein
MQRSRLSQRRERRSDDRQRIELQIEPGPWLLPTRTCFCALASACGPRRKVSRELDGSASYEATVRRWSSPHPRISTQLSIRGPPGRRTKKGPRETEYDRCPHYSCLPKPRAWSAAVATHAACARRVVTLYKIETCIDVRSSISVHTPAERTYARGLRIRTHWYNYRRQLATEVGLACKY